MTNLNIFSAGSFLPPTGILASAKLAIVGEYPTYREIQVKELFAGGTGRILTKALSQVGLTKSDCYLTYVIKDLDNAWQSRWDSKAHEFRPQGQQYVSALQQELSELKSNFIVACGEIALKALTGKTGIYNWRGSVIESTLIPGKWVIPCLHPSTVLPPQCIYLNQWLIGFDIKRAAGAARKKTYTPYKCIIETDPPYSRILHYIYSVLPKATLIAFDIEAYKKQVDCISFSTTPRHAISIPFYSSESGNLWSSEQELEIWKGIAKVLEDPKIEKVGQNLSFDNSFLLNRYGICPVNCHDTMVAQQVACPDFKKNLGFITSIHTELPFHKDEGKDWDGVWQNRWAYNAKDSLVCRIALKSQLKDLEEQGNLVTYDRQRGIIEPLVFLQEHGVKADVDWIRKKSLELEVEIHRKREELDELAGQELNPNSPKQLKEYFHGKLGYTPYKNKGKISYNNIAMKRLKRKGVKEAEKILDIRRLRKQLGTYVKTELFDSDGRLRCSYNPVGTRYSRLSSSGNIFGTGTNMQNWPHVLLWCLMTDPHYVGYAMDLSNAENRIVAYQGKVRKMIQAFEEEVDTHSLTGSMIFGGTWQEIKAEDTAKIMCDLGDGTKTKRQWAKPVNHGSNYGIGYKALALKLEIPEKEGQFLLGSYHKGYPEVREIYHDSIKAQLYKNRTITNLMGRKTVFLGEINHMLLKEAYSCIPQGTVGDVINERGMSYVYDNPELFSPIELLGQVHDEIQFQIPSPSHPTRPVSWEDHAKMVKLIKTNLEIPLVAHGREFVIPVDTTLFKRFKNGKDLTSKQVDQEGSKVAKLLEKTWEGVKEKTTKKAKEM